MISNSLAAFGALSSSAAPRPVFGVAGACGAPLPQVAWPCCMVSPPQLPASPVSLRLRPMHEAAVFPFRAVPWRRLSGVPRARLPSALRSVRVRAALLKLFHREQKYAPVGKGPVRKGEVVHVLYM